MIIYCCLGTAPLGKDRLAAVDSGVDQVLVAFPDVAEYPEGLLGLGVDLVDSSIAFFKKEQDPE